MDLTETTLTSNLNNYDITYVDEKTLSKISLNVIEENDEAYKELAK